MKKRPRDPLSYLDPNTITRLLHDAREGDSTALEALLPLVYAELRSLANPIFNGERRDHTLQPTAVVHEAWMKVEPHLDRVGDRTHFFAIASRAMRQVLTDHARHRARSKRGGSKERVTLDGALSVASTASVDLIELDDLLSRLALLDARHARVVELRVLGGLTIEETAEVLDVGHSTIERDWFTAKGWLRAELGRA